MSKQPTLSGNPSLSTEKVNITEQIEQFWEQIRQFNWLDKRFLLYAAGFFVTFFYIFSPDLPKTLHSVIAFVHIFLLFKLVHLLKKQLKPPSEALWSFLAGLWLIEYLLVRFILPSPVSIVDDLQTGVFSNSFQILFLVLLELTLALLILVNTTGKGWVLIWLLLLRFPIASMLDSESYFLSIVFQAILVLIFLKQTSWLDRLNQIECLIYGGIFLAILQILFWLNPVADVGERTFLYQEIWFELPGVFYQYLRAYVLAVVIKIPAILIYNHASLARKLKISGLFQSSIPQLIQLVSLILIFYSFITTWQAQTVRGRIVDFLQSATAAPESEKLHHFTYIDSEATIKLDGYEPINARFLPRKGVLRLVPQNNPFPDDSLSGDYFLFARTETEDSTETLTLTKIDTTFLAREIANPQRYLGGSELLFYPAGDDQWLWHYRRFDLWQIEQDMHIFPVGLINYSRINPLAVPIRDSSSGELNNSQVTFGFLQYWKFTFGRVFVPIWEDRNTGKFAVFDVVLQVRPTFQWNDLLTVIAIALLVYLLLNFFIIQRMIGFGTQIHKIIIKKFKQLRDGIQQISAGNLDYQIHFEGNDEFVELGQSFNKMGERLKETMEERREKDRLQFELQNARDVQIGLLPHHLPQTPGFEVAAVLHTATEVGGDFYDIFSVKNDANGQPTRILFTIGDVSGKGSSAALYMAQCMSLIRFSSQFTDDPGQICQQLNNYFATKVGDRQIFVTLIIGMLDVENNKVTFVRAGHTEPVLMPGDYRSPIRFLKSKGLGIGLSAKETLFEKNLESVSLDLSAGDTLVFYTDGVIEANRPKSDGEGVLQFEEKQLLDKLNGLRGKTATAIQQNVDAALNQFYGSHARVDDHTLMVIRCSGK
ncbi:MAG: SpoIIE family protein phosphatase [Calditrichia bacterium]